MLAQTIKADIFVTIGSTEKKDFGMKTYGIPEDHIFSSRDASFEQELMDITGQRGVDVVLNSTAGDLLQRSWQCLAPFGRSLEIGKRDMVQDSNIGMGKFLDSVLFAGVDVGNLGRTKPPVFKKLLAKVVNLFESGAIKPVQPITVFPISELQKANSRTYSILSASKRPPPPRATCPARTPSLSSSSLDPPAPPPRPRESCSRVLFPSSPAF